MPKGNPGRLKDRFEIRGELVPNEYEYQQQHGEMTEQENFPPAEGQDVPEAGSSPQEQRRARIAETEARAHEIVERRRAKQGKSAQSGASKGGGRKGAKKSARKKSAAKRGRASSKGRAAGGAKKSASKRGAKKSSAKKGGGKKSAGKSKKAGARKKAAKRR
ncbi:MAG TPA: hypothetical protein VKB86_03145 [Pyrinomonadaceae bacterium]|nr:hypothetical protein [Pyrinomonadaceae bacterium]